MYNVRDQKQNLLQHNNKYYIMTIRLGNIQLDTPVILAPMSGVTDLPFRKLVKKFGACMVVSEMIASRAMILHTRQSMQKCAIEREDATGAIVQLAGCDPEVMAEAAKINEDLGAKVIDINFGCPVKKVVGGNAGSALMRDEVLAGKILEATAKAVKIPVTLKMRMGWDHSSLNAPNIARIAENSGIQMLTIHGRTRCQLYNGVADWKFIQQVKGAVKLPVIANGDITTFEKAQQALEQSGADGIMVGRGCYGRPWFINQVKHYLNDQTIIAEPSLTEKHQIILEHFEAMLEHYGTENGVRMARKHLGWYSSGMPNSSEFRAKVNLINDPGEVKNKINDYFAQVTEKYDQSSLIIN